jgi:sialate O-acetylesterase
MKKRKVRMNKLIVKMNFAVGATLVAFSLHAVQLPKIFGDDMVLQRSQRVPVWGKAKSGEKITVEFAGQSLVTQAGKDGRWRVDLEPLEAESKGRDFRVKGENEIVFTNVVVGEVWFCSGQSNMEYPMCGLAHCKTRRIKNWEKEKLSANYPLLRHFKVPRTASEKPLEDVVKAKWVKTTPESVRPQSAVAYIFGETLMKELGVPVGLINCSWGGTRIEAWTPAAHQDDLWLLQNIKTWKRRQDVPTVLWNGMVSGLVPYAIKGSIWYQGCANRADGAAYLDKTVALVRGWRREWGQGDFPYFLVQLAPFKYDKPKGGILPIIQETQARVPEKVPSSGYTVINDVGNINDIHPDDKRTVGMRLADQVLDRIYGKFTRPWKTPVAVSAKADGATVRVKFENAEGLKTRDALAPTNFELCAAKGQWKSACAKIEGDEVVLTAEGVTEPTNVRFAPYNASTPNLVNGAGLPAGPFRMKVDVVK